MRALIGIAAALAALPLVSASAQDISAPGTVAHRAARTGFPERVGDFRRTHVLRYDQQGEDLSANYDLIRDDGRMRLSIYIYPAPAAEPAARTQACRAELDEVAQSITRQHGGAEQLESGEAPAVPGSAPGLRLRSVHRIRIALRNPKPEDVRSETRLFCYIDGGWQVKYRISSNADFEVGNAIDTFIRLGPWPGRQPGEVVLRSHHRSGVLG